MTKLPEQFPLAAWLGIPENKIFNNTYMETSRFNISTITK